MTVTFDGVKAVEAIEAVKLGAAGVDVPEELIFYDDDATIDDEEFDGDWQTIDSDIAEEEKYLRLEIKVNSDIKNWISSNEIDVALLMERLIHNAYETAQLIKK